MGPPLRKWSGGAFCFCHHTSAAGAPVTLDGDTIVIDGTHIRIANIDAPEIRGFHCDGERRLGLVAKHRMAELLASGP